MESNSTGDLFSKSEMKGHINLLELKAILFGLKALEKGLTKIHIIVLTDNSTTVACINKFGTCRSQECDSIKKVCNTLTRNKKYGSRFEYQKYEIHTEWKLNESAFYFICGELGFSPAIDLFATRLNTQLRTFVSYRPDPNCIAVNAFLINCEKEKFYVFPQFACLSKILQKIYQDKAKVILIAPG